MATVAPVFNVVGFAGSLRRGSYNRALLRAATELAPPALDIVIHELDGIPCTTVISRLPALRRACCSLATPFAGRMDSQHAGEHADAHVSRCPFLGCAHHHLIGYDDRSLLVAGSSESPELAASWSHGLPDGYVSRQTSVSSAGEARSSSATSLSRGQGVWIICEMKAFRAKVDVFEDLLRGSCSISAGTQGASNPHQALGSSRALLPGTHCVSPPFGGAPAWSLAK